MEPETPKIAADALRNREIGVKIADSGSCLLIV